MTSPDPVRTGRGTPARRRAALVAVAALGVGLVHLENRSFRACITATTDDPRLAVMIACSTALNTAYRALFVLLLAVTGVRRYRTHRKGITHV